METESVQTFLFRDDGTFPNHGRLPVLLYPGVLREQTNRTERIFNVNRWLNSWTGGVFDYPHYHSNTHEVLGVVSGTATLRLGGERGQELPVHPGDVIILPAGTALQRIKASPDLQVVGAYPEGSDYNLYTGKPDERVRAREEIPDVPVPETDPVFGKVGPLKQYWS